MITIRAAGKQDVPAIKKLMQAIPGFWQPTWSDEVVQRGIDCAIDAWGGLSQTWCFCGKCSDSTSF